MSMCVRGHYEAMLYSYIVEQIKKKFVWTKLKKKS